MRKLLLVLVGCALGALVVGGVAVATEGEDRDAGTPSGAESSPAREALGGAQAPNARLVAVVDGGATAGNFVVRRGKNIQSVTNPDTGIFCITPRPGAGITPGAAVPIVSTEFDGTPSDNHFANWDRTPDDCGPGKIEVQAFELGVGDVNDVGFTVVVP